MSNLYWVVGTGDRADRERDRERVGGRLLQKIKHKVSKVKKSIEMVLEGKKWSERDKMLI